MRNAKRPNACKTAPLNFEAFFQNNNCLRECQNIIFLLQKHVLYAILIYKILLPILAPKAVPPVSCISKYSSIYRDYPRVEEYEMIPHCYMWVKCT